MDLERTEKLAQLMERYSLSHVEVGVGEERLVLSRTPFVVSTPVASAALSPAEPMAETSAGAINEENALVCPLVGCVYLAPGPSANPFVTVGSSVKKGQVLCIVEAMKVMNEFTASRAGVIAEVCVKDGQLVEFGQPLFRLQ